MKIKKIALRILLLLTLLSINLVSLPILANGEEVSNEEEITTIEEKVEEPVIEEAPVVEEIEVQQQVVETSALPTVSYQTHVQNVGWMNYVNNGAISGTTGKSLRLEGIRIKLNTTEDLGIKYTTHIQNIGWQPWKSNDGLSGTEGKSLRLEGIKIELTGSAASKYDIYYSVHIQDYGWLAWSKNGEAAGSEGLSKRLEGIKIKIVAKGANIGAEGINVGRSFINQYGLYNPSDNGTYDVKYKTHVQNVGWQNWTNDGKMSGTEGKSLRLEALYITLGADIVGPTDDGSIVYRSHVQDIGWQNWVSNGQMTGTSGRSKRMEAISIKLTGVAASKYDIYYRVHVQNMGWLGWAKNGEDAGSAGYAYRAEGIQIKIVPKGGTAPGSTENHFVDKANEVIDINSQAGDIVYLQTQDKGNFLYSSGNKLQSGVIAYNNVNYQWKIIKDENKYILQNVGTKLVLNSSLNLSDYNGKNEVLWNLKSKNASTDTYTIGNIATNKYLNSVSGNLSLATENSNSYVQNINLIYTVEKNNFEILGTSSISKDKIKTMFISKISSKPNNYYSTNKIPDTDLTYREYYDKVIDAYYSIAPKYGIKPEVALMQAFHETGWLQFGGLVKIDQFNFAGIGATGTPITDTNLRGADPSKASLVVGENAIRFSSVENGVEAHVQHIYAYASTTKTTDVNSDGILEIKGYTLADPRFNLVATINRGASTILPALNGRWAVPGYTYGQIIMNFLDEVNPVER